MEISTTAAKHGYLASAVEMCTKLIADKKLGLDAVFKIFSVAEKFGPPLDILKAVEGYGNIQAIQKELVELRGKVSEEKILLGSLTGQYNQILEQLSHIIAAALKAGSEVTKVEALITRSNDLEALLNLIHNPNTVGFEDGGPSALTIAISLRKWVKEHEKRIKCEYYLLSNLNLLISELGGD